MRKLDTYCYFCHRGIQKFFRLGNNFQGQTSKVAPKARRLFSARLPMFAYLTSYLRGPVLNYGEAQDMGEEARLITYPSNSRARRPRGRRAGRGFEKVRKLIRS